jgi:hypothetical protein
MSTGTTANVSVNLFGYKNDGMTEMHTGPRQLARPGAFRRGGVDSFVVTSDTPFGVISRVSVWHDNGGASPSWYLARLVVRDLQSNNCRHFIANQWLTLDRLDEADSRIEAELTSPGELRVS